MKKFERFLLENDGDATIKNFDELSEDKQNLIDETFVDIMTDARVFEVKDLMAKSVRAYMEAVRELKNQQFDQDTWDNLAIMIDEISALATQYQTQIAEIKEIHEAEFEAIDTEMMKELLAKLNVSSLSDLS